MASVLKTGFDNPVVWAKGPEEGKLQESGFNSIWLQLKVVVVVVVCVCVYVGGGGGGAESMRGTCFPPSGASSAAATPTKGNTLISFTFLAVSRVQRNRAQVR
jgi:hypothetical protein